MLGPTPDGVILASLLSILCSYFTTKNVVYQAPPKGSCNVAFSSILSKTGSFNTRRLLSNFRSDKGKATTRQKKDRFSPLDRASSSLSSLGILISIGYLNALLFIFLLDGKIHCPHSTNQFDTLTLGGVIYALEVNNKGNLVVPRAEVARN